MKRLMQCVAAASIMFSTNVAFGAGYHYCSGMVKDLITRGTHEDTQVLIEGMNGWARIGYGGEAYSDMQERQFAMLLAAYMAGKKVTVEFDDNSLNCTNDHTAMLIRYVRLN